MIRATGRPRSCRGVTLLEVLLAMALLVVLTSMTFWFYQSSLDTRQGVTADAQRQRIARAVLGRIEQEIRQISVVTANGRTGLRGQPERIWLSTVRLPVPPSNPFEVVLDETEPGEYDLVKVEYKILRHPDVQHDDGYDLPLGLARLEIRDNRPDSAESGEAFREDGEGMLEDFEEVPLEGEEAPPEEEEVEILDEDVDVGLGPDVRWGELYAPEIKYLRFCYYDGKTWWNDWDVRGQNPLPQIVQVTIGFNERPPYGEGLDFGVDDDEFCNCLNANEDIEEIDECEPFGEDTYTILVRVPQADRFFGSRIARETQGLLEEVGF